MDPRECSSCYSLTCAPCIKQWTTIQNTCPTCRVAYKNSNGEQINRFVKNQLNKTQFRCNQCPETFEYQTHKDHMEKCFSSVDCPKCSETNFGSLAELKKHLETSCKKMSVTCNHCDEATLREDSNKHDCIKALKTLIGNKKKLIQRLTVKK